MAQTVVYIVAYGTSAVYIIKYCRSRGGYRVHSIILTQTEAAAESTV